jgi:UDP-glucuronate decarboxylase
VLLHGKFDIFNIGMDNPELSVKDFAGIFTQAGKEILNYQGKISFNVSPDKEYLTDNPNRRCPDISKAREKLGYNPTVLVDTGIRRYLEFLKINNGKL